MQEWGALIPDTKTKARHHETFLCTRKSSLRALAALLSLSQRMPRRERSRSLSRSVLDPQPTSSRGKCRSVRRSFTVHESTSRP